MTNTIWWCSYFWSGTCTNLFCNIQKKKKHLFFFFNNKWNIIERQPLFLSRFSSRVLSTVFKSILYRKPEAYKEQEHTQNELTYCHSFILLDRIKVKERNMWNHFAFIIVWFIALMSTLCLPENETVKMHCLISCIETQQKFQQKNISL